MSQPINFVIIGGSYAGLQTAKRLFSHSRYGKRDIHVTLVSWSTHAFYNVGTPRFLVEPALIEKHALLGVETFLKRLSSEQAKYSFIHGKAIKADFDAKTVKVSKIDDNASITLSYDYLVIASGSSAESNAFKLNTTFEDSLSSLTKLSASIKSSQKIAVIGGGPTGVETASEISQMYHEKEVTLYTGGGAPLEILAPKVAKSAESQLKGLGIDVINNVRSTKIEKIADGREKVSFDDGTTESFDLVITSVKYVPNTQFIDAQFKNEAGYIKTDEHLCVQGHRDAVVVGDAADKGDHSLVELTYFHVPLVSRYLGSTAFGKSAKPYPYKERGTISLVPISRYGGVGDLYGWSIPKLACRFAKSRDFWIPQSKSFYD